MEQRFLRQAGDDGVVDLEQGAIPLRGALRLLERADLVAPSFCPRLASSADGESHAISDLGGSGDPPLQGSWLRY